MAVCQASVMDPLGAAVAAVTPRWVNGATKAAPPANRSLLLSAMELVDPPLSSPMVSSLRGHRFPGGLCDWVHAAGARVLIRRWQRCFCDQSTGLLLHLRRQGCFARSLQAGRWLGDARCSRATA